METKSETDLEAIVQILSDTVPPSTQIGKAMTNSAADNLWRSFRQKYPAVFSVSPEEIKQWHLAQVEESEKEQNWTAVIFHLDRLLASGDKQESLRPRRLHAANRLTEKK